jgi:threonine dehydratase
MIPLDWLEEASHRIAPYIRITPITYDQEYQLFLKWENRQLTGSFKIRGAINKVSALQAWERERGLVAASAGNHGQGVALAGNLFQAQVTIFCPENAVPAKVAAIRKLGAIVRLVPGGYGEAEKAGIRYASESGSTWISPYNDGQVIAGQGTLALEALEQEPATREATWVVPVGGGGLISGIGSAIKQLSQVARLVAVQAEASAFLYHIYTRGSAEGVIDHPTLADGLSGPVESNSMTIPLIHQYIDEFVLVTEIEIKKAIALAWHRYQEVIEGSAATTLAAVTAGRIDTRPAVLVISGGNIQPEVHKKIISETRGQSLD